MTDMPQLDENTKALYEIAQAINRLTLVKVFELRAHSIDQGKCSAASESSSLFLANEYFLNRAVTAATIDDVAADADNAINRLHIEGKANSDCIAMSDYEEFDRED